MQNDRDIFFVSIFTFLTVTSWIFFELVKTVKTTTVTTTTQQLLTPLPKTFDQATLQMLEQRRTYLP